LREKSSCESEFAEAKSPLNNVLSDASARNEASTTGEEVYEVDEHFVEKRPSRSIRVPKKEEVRSSVDRRDVKHGR